MFAGQVSREGLEFFSGVDTGETEAQGSGYHDPQDVSGSGARLWV